MIKDLSYKIYSAWLYQDQLAHDWIFLYNRDIYSLRANSAPLGMFSNFRGSASHEIYEI
jgi:hypothetical protein